MFEQSDHLDHGAQKLGTRDCKKTTLILLSVVFFKQSYCMYKEKFLEMQ